MANEQNSFAFWKDRIEAAESDDALAATVRDAFEAMVPKDKVDRKTQDELEMMVLGFVAKKGDLGEQKVRAVKALEPFSALAALGAQQAPEPAPKKKKKKAAAKKEEAAPAAPAAEDPKNAKFNEVFTTAICRFIERKLDPFQIPPTDSPLPFLMSPQFGFDFIQAMRKYIVPYMIESRRIKMMAESMNEAELDEAHFMQLFADPDAKTNTARFIWLDRWGDFRMAIKAQQKKGKGEDEKEEKEGLLNKLLGKKKKKAPKGPNINPALAKEAKGFWDLIQGDGSYDPPKVGDLELFESLFEYEAAKIEKSKQGLVQMLAQESGIGPTGAVGAPEGREGSSRQYISREINAMPNHCGEWVALWAYYTHTQSFTDKILKSFLAGQGTSAKERKRVLPYFLRWVPDLVSKQGLGG